MRDVLQVLMDLVRIPSTNPPGNEHLIAPYLANFLRELGAQITCQEVYPGRSNIIGEWSWGRGHRLLFNTHMDVHNPEGQVWSMDPFEPVLHNGRLYGRGTADAKGSLAAMLCAIERLVQDPRGLKGTLLFTIVMGEESGGHGTAHLISSGCAADGAVVGEPTELQIKAANKGTFIRRISFTGRAAHSGQSHLGINAIEPACQLLQRVFAYQEEVLSRQKHHLVGNPSLIPTLIGGGTAQNTVPGSCYVVLDRRLVPGESHDFARQELADLIEQAGVADRVYSIEEIVKTDPCETALDSAVVLAAQQSLDKHGKATEVGGFPAGCDMSKLVLWAGIPSVILGPGSLAQAHGPDEYVEVEQVRVVTLVYEDMARSFLRGEQ